MRYIKRIQIAVLISLIMVISIIDFYGILLLRNHGCWARPIAVNDLARINANYSYDPNVLESFANEFTCKDPVILLQQTMNSVNKIEKTDYSNAWEAYSIAKSGKGLLCDGMAEIYLATLTSNGIPSRMVVLRKNIFEIYDTHATVEVFKDNRWVIYDPTFNCSFEKNGQLIGAQEISDSLYDGTAVSIKPVFYGEVKYPARLEEYYIDWLPLYNNVSVMDNSSRCVLFKLPPLRYWKGSVEYYEQKTSFPSNHMEYTETIYRFIIVILPVVIILLAITLMIILFRVYRGRQNTNSSDGEPHVRT